MDEADKNGGPNFLRQWREYRKMSRDDLAKRLHTNPNMIGYLESGERGLSAKWLRKLADVLETTPGLILEYDPSQGADGFEVLALTWRRISDRDRSRALKALEVFIDSKTA